MQGQLWRAAVFEDKHKTNGSSVSDLEFCCEDHFDVSSQRYIAPLGFLLMKLFVQQISNDLNKRFSTGASVEYTIKAGTVPSIKLSESKLELSNEVSLMSISITVRSIKFPLSSNFQVNVQRLADKNLHHRVIINNRLAYLYGSKYPQLMDRLQTTDMLSFVAVNGESRTTEIKTEPMDGGLEYEICTKPEVSTIDSNPLELEAKSKYESDTESESSNDRRKEDYDPDVTTDDLPSDDGDDSYEWSEHDGSDDSLESENEEGDVIPEDEKNHERFECRYCGQLVRNLDTHVERSHWRFAKNLNRTHCGLCWKVYPKQSDLRKHQGYVHNGNAYSCDICDTLTRTYETMRIHILRAHSNERTLLCQHCGKSYKFIWELRRHVQTIHFDVQRERTHACEHCDKKFFSAAILRRHVKEVHLNLRPYNCDVDGCNKAFKQPFHLKVHHTQVHAKLNLFSCVICDKKFSLKCNLVAHMKNVHKN